MNSLLYFPSRHITATPALAGLDFEDLSIETDDGERLGGWWIPAADGMTAGDVLLCHGNGGNVSDRVLHAALLHAAGFGVLLFDYRGYGRSTGRTNEEGTYRDARAALRLLIERAGDGRLIYLGESLGGAVALDLALEQPPRGLILQSAFTSVRDMARLHYPILPPALVPDAYPAIDRIHRLRAPLLVLHGDRDEIVPLIYGEALFAAAPEPKLMRILGAGHNDLLAVAGDEWAAEIAAWAAGLV